MQQTTNPVADRTKTNQYVPLKEYTENQFLHDYHFLSSIGRKVSSVGSHLLSQGMLPQQVEANMNALNRQPPGAAVSAPGPSYRADFDTVKHLKMRNALKQEFRRRRCKVIFLPEGMAREKESTCRYDERAKKLKMSMGVKFDKSKEQTFHHLPSNLPVQVKVLSELERQSWKVAPQEWKQTQEAQGGAQGNGARGGKRARKRQKRQQQSVDDAEGAEEIEEVAAQAPGGETSASTDTSRHKTFFISDFVLSQHGLLASNASSPSTTPRAYSHLPSSIALTVQVHNTRLRNESSLKYLEWWERKGKLQEQEEDDDEDDRHDDAIIQQQTEAIHRLMRPWGQPGGSDATHPSSTETHQPFIPSSILSSLSAQLDVVKAAAEQHRNAKEATEKHVQAKTLLDYQDDDNEDNEAQPVASDSVGAPSKPNSRRHVYVLPSTDNHGTSEPTPSFINIEALLRSIPTNWAVVEYPTIEVHLTKDLYNSQEVDIVKHADSSTDVVNLEGPMTDRHEAKPVSIDAASASASGSAPALPAASPKQIIRPVPVQSQTPVKSNLGLGLGAYDSDSESESEEVSNADVSKQEPPPPQPAAVKRVKTLAERELLANRSSNASASAETSSDESDGRIREAAPGGLADLARSLGFVKEKESSVDVSKLAAPAAPAVEDEETKADALVMSAGEATDEDEVDWDEA